MPSGRFYIAKNPAESWIYISGKRLAEYEIEDNGIGREEAKRRRSKTATRQKSHGMEITNQRLEIVNKLYDVHASVTIKDLVNADGEAEGTAVLLNIKYKTSSLTWNSNQPT
jgi:hypothetical protein